MTPYDLVPGSQPRAKMIIHLPNPCCVDLIPIPPLLLMVTILLSSQRQLWVKRRIRSCKSLPKLVPSKMAILVVHCYPIPSPQLNISSATMEEPPGSLAAFPWWVLPGRPPAAMRTIVAISQHHTTRWPSWGRSPGHPDEAKSWLCTTSNRTNSL